MHEEVENGVEKEVSVNFNNLSQNEMFKELQKEIEKQMRQMKESDDRKGEELDKQKYIELISEFKKFKRNSVQHLRFNSSSIIGEF